MDTKIDLHRFDDQLAELRAMLAEQPPVPGGVLLYGSSTMANWRADGMDKEQLAPLAFTNMGFGGSTAEEALYYYHDLVKPVAPKVMAYYEGANDLMNGYSPEEILSMTHRLFEWCRQDFPGIRFLIVPIKLCPALDPLKDGATACNEAFASYAESHEDTEVLDLTAYLYDEKGDYRRELYVEDMLHHTREGYTEFATFVKPALERLLK